VQDRNTWNLWIVGPLSRLEACTSGMRVDALCKPHAGIGCSFDTPKHLIHIVTAIYRWSLEIYILSCLLLAALYYRISGLCLLSRTTPNVQLEVRVSFIRDITKSLAP
jgi:hypothetical protein